MFLLRFGLLSSIYVKAYIFSSQSFVATYEYNWAAADIQSWNSQVQQEWVTKSYIAS